jgi:hypothetical protein
MTQSRLAVTGTPGTGKTTATEHADTSVTHLNDIIHESEAEFTTHVMKNAIHLWLILRQLARGLVIGMVSLNHIWLIILMLMVLLSSDVTLKSLNAASGSPMSQQHQ